MFVASDPNALIHHTREVFYLSDGEIGLLTKETVEIFDASMMQISKKTEQLLHSVEEASKGEFEHFTLKEIFEQPQTIRNAMLSRFFEEYGTVAFEGLDNGRCGLSRHPTHSDCSLRHFMACRVCRLVHARRARAYSISGRNFI